MVFLLPFRGVFCVINYLQAKTWGVSSPELERLTHELFLAIKLGDKCAKLGAKIFMNIPGHVTHHMENFWRDSPTNLDVINQDTLDFLPVSICKSYWGSTQGGLILKHPWEHPATHPQRGMQALASRNFYEISRRSIAL